MFIMGITSIAILVIGGLLLVSLAGRESTAVRDAPPPPDAGATAAANRRALPAPAAAGSTATVQESARLASRTDAPPDSPRASKAYRPPYTHRAPRGGINGLVASLGELQPRIARCSGGGAAPAAPADQAVLVLELEPMDGAVKVVGARVHTMGKAREATVACARDVLVGQVLDVPEARPGKPVSIPYPIAQ
jgi:hypothetical protein